jgi:hypothetical protein
MSFVVSATGGCEFIARATVALRGSRSCAACRKNVRTKRSFVMAWRLIHSTLWGFTLVHEADSCGSRDEGKTWGKILEGLPSVVCVRTAVVEDSSDGLVPTLPKAAPAPSSSHQKTKSQSKSKTCGTKSRR